MELKSYQRSVLEDLDAFLQELRISENPAVAFDSFWKSKPLSPARRYFDLIPSVADVCIKIPTGGGKTFVACNALRVIKDALPSASGRPVVWFVPSLSILDQTLLALRSSTHPYRQKLESLFAGRVEILDKVEALSGVGFDPDSVRRNLTVLVVSYDSFRSSSKEGRKVHQENSRLSGFSMSGRAVGAEGVTMSLASVLADLRPIVIVDESHNARSVLSIEMVKELNPSFVLELTATPRNESNVITYVDAAQLKREQMVKLPVIVYNTIDVNEVIRTAIDLRLKLERAAVEQQRAGEPYIRPIALFQAEPKREDATDEAETFSRIRDKLLAFGIPADQIAIKTADINELKGIDLFSEACPIRYVLTVNALKEGWDCSFAYVLASLANKSSAVDVEQIVGRILRLPHTRLSHQRFLNLSYVLTASSRFLETLQYVVAGLNRSGFSDRDYRAIDADSTARSGAETPGPGRNSESLST